MDKVRCAVVNALVRQEAGGYCNLVLQSVLGQHSEFGPRDKSFLSAVFYGTVERQFTIDYLLQKCLNRPLEKLDAVVRAILRAGLYQARWMNGVPVRAAVYESVLLTKEMRKASASGLVNAVLRKASALNLEQQTFTSELQRLSVLYSVSPQIAQLFWEKIPDCEAVLQAGFLQPQISIRVNTLKTTQCALEEYFQEKKIAVREAKTPGCLYVDYSGDFISDAAFQKGWFHVQGEASQIACAALSPQPGQKVLDVCAAPGGKSVTLAQYMQNRGELCASDAAPNRLSLIEKAFQRCGVECGHVIYADASVFHKEFDRADAILCDVPCSGLGILSKKPDIRHKNLDGISELVQLQKKFFKPVQAI